MTALGSHVVTATHPEDVLDATDIQGNSLAGFKKDHQVFLFATIEDVPGAKGWLKEMRPRIATLEQVLHHNRKFKYLKRLNGIDPGELKATWINIAFSAPGLAKLTAANEVQAFSTTFVNGLHVSSPSLGDPTNPALEGNPLQWRVGGPHNLADLVVIIASDDPDDLEATTADTKGSMFAPSGGRAPAFRAVFEQRCMVRPDLPGHEHFGFKDGISQPAPRGSLSSASDSFLSPRVVEPSDPRSAFFGEPGQPLVWPGQFVLGYQRQDSHSAISPVPAAVPTPVWAKNGSYVVVRRLKQDVSAFWNSISQLAAQFGGMAPERLGALLVGRWTSGAPLMRTPAADDFSLAADDLANNNFQFKNAVGPAPIIPSMNYGGDHFPTAPGDLLGMVCPHAAHVRKANPRDLPTDTGGQNDTLTRLIIRRGIPFGPPMVNPLAPTSEELANERGLVFVSYQTSIKNQFEFLLNHWANVDNQPQSGGMDPLLGQRFAADGTNRRVILIPASNGALQQAEIDAPWITPTGGGYFFSPSISAIQNTLSLIDR